MGFTAVLNGNLFDITTMSVTVDGVPYTRGVFSELNYSFSQEPGKFMGNQITTTGLTPGHAEGKGSMKMLRSYFDDLAKQLQDDGWPSVSGVDFDISVTYLVNNFGPTPADDSVTVNLIGCRITNADLNTSGTDALTADLQLFIHRIQENGITLFGDEDDQQAI